MYVQPLLYFILFHLLTIPRIQSLLASSITIRSSNGPITGQFNATGEGKPLSIRTSNGAIKVDVGVLGYGGKETEVEMKTSNAYVISL